MSMQIRLLIPAIILCSGLLGQGNKLTVTGEGTATLTVTNLSKAAITAYIYSKTAQVPQPDGRVLQIPSVVSVDTVISPTPPSIASGEQRNISARGRSSAQLTFKAALFSDGSSFGDSTYVQQMLNRRRYELDALTRTNTVVEQGVSEHVSVDELLSRLNSAKAEAGQTVTEPFHRAAINAVSSIAAGYLAQHSSQGLSGTESAVYLNALKEHLNQEIGRLQTALSATPELPAH